MEDLNRGTEGVKKTDAIATKLQRASPELRAPERSTPIKGICRVRIVQEKGGEPAGHSSQMRGTQHADGLLLRAPTPPEAARRRTEVGRGEIQEQRRGGFCFEFRYPLYPRRTPSVDKRPWYRGGRRNAILRMRRKMT